MSYESIAIVYVAFMYLPVYIATTLTSKDREGNLMPLNSMIKVLLYSISAVSGFFSLQLALGISIANTYAASIEKTIGTVWQLVIWLSIIMLFILLFGIGYNTIANGSDYLQKLMQPRGRNGKR